MMDDVQRAGSTTDSHRDHLPSPPAKGSFWKSPAVILTGGLLAASLAFLGLRTLAFHWSHESTDDAFLEAHVVSIAPKVAGLIQTVSVKENAFVRTGDLLAEIDARDFQVKLAQKQAAAESAEATRRTYESSFELIRARVATAQATANQTRAEAEAAAATAEWANDDLRRNRDMRGHK